MIGERGVLFADGIEHQERKQIYTQALLAALSVDDLELSAILVDKGADSKAKLSDGMPVLMAAALLANSHAGQELVRKMLNEGADINASSTDGITALMVVDRLGLKDFRDYLLIKGAKDYQREDNINKARATKIDAMLLDKVIHYYMIATSARREDPILFEKLNDKDDGFFPQWPIWGIVANKGKDLFGNPFTIKPAKAPVYVFISDATIAATAQFVDKAFWKPYFSE